MIKDTRLYYAAFKKCGCLVDWPVSEGLKIQIWETTGYVVKRLSGDKINKIIDKKGVGCHCGKIEKPATVEANTTDHGKNIASLIRQGRYNPTMTASDLYNILYQFQMHLAERDDGDGFLAEMVCVFCEEIKNMYTLVVKK